MTDTLIAPLDSPVPDAPPAAATKRRRWRRPGLGVLLAVIWLFGIAFLAIFADYLQFIRGYAQRVPGATRFAYGPGADFWFGSDQLGRDVFARCIYGARITIIVATASIITGIVIGGTLGLIAGYRRGPVDRTVSVVTDSLLAFPALILAILIVGRFDALRNGNPGAFGWLSRTWSIVFVLSLLSIAPIARIVRAQTLSLSQREFVLAARSVGAKNSRVIFREILPNLVPAMVSVAFTGIAILLVAEGALAFLGYSVQAPTPTWGYLINEGRPQIERAWWATLMPCFMLFMTVLAFNLIGDRIARHFDIREATL